MKPKLVILPDQLDVDFVQLSLMYLNSRVISVDEARETLFPVGTVLVWRPLDHDCCIVLTSGGEA